MEFGELKICMAVVLGIALVILAAASKQQVVAADHDNPHTAEFTLPGVAGDVAELRGQKSGNFEDTREKSSRFFLLPIKSHAHNEAHQCPVAPCAPELSCCKKQCVNVNDDCNNCGRCHHKCKHGLLCCAGDCVDILHSKPNCGACHNMCPGTTACIYGICGYGN
jgi:hypothetical protein